MKKNYVANLIGEGVFDADLPVDRPDPRPVRVGDEGVLLLYGDREGGTVCVAAYDEDDAARRLAATFSDTPTIDDLQESVDQRPLSVAYTEGRADESVHHLLVLDDRVRQYVDERAAAVLDLALASALADARPSTEPKPKRYLDFRFDITDLAEDEISGLWGEVAAQAERSERHPFVPLEGELVEHPAEDEPC